MSEWPFHKAKRAILWMAMVNLVVIVVLSSISNSFPPEVPAEAIEAGFTAAQSNFIGVHIRSATYSGALMGSILSLVAIQIALTVLERGTLKDRSKTDNEEEEE